MQPQHSTMENQVHEHAHLAQSCQHRLRLCLLSSKSSQPKDCSPGKQEKCSGRAHCLRITHKPCWDPNQPSKELQCSLLTHPRDREQKAFVAPLSCTKSSSQSCSSPRSHSSTKAQPSESPTSPREGTTHSQPFFILNFAFVQPEQSWGLFPSCSHRPGGDSCSPGHTEGRDGSRGGDDCHCPH